MPGYAYRSFFAGSPWRIAAVLLGAAAAAPSWSADSLPSVASINLCADQIVLAVADAEQILTVSWLAADANESLFAEAAARYPLNYGTAEELLRFDPDVVIAGAYTSAFTRALLRRLDYEVVELNPETTVAEIEDNLRTVARAIGQADRGERAVTAIRETARSIERHRAPFRPAAVVVRPGGFTVGRHSLADELLGLAGIRNVAAEQGLDRWGSLSMEAVLRSSPELIVFTGYRLHEPSLANVVLQHPVLEKLRAERRTVNIPAAYWACGLPQSLDSATLLQQAVAP